MYITELEYPEYSDTYNRFDGYHHPIVLHKNWSFHLGRFPSRTKLKEFLDFAGLEIARLIEKRYMGKCGMYRQWDVKPVDLEEHGFNKVEDLPRDAKAFTGLSNGNLVTCYLKNDGKTLKIYRPNPNCKEVYKPLSIEDHISFCRENGYV